MTEYFLIFADLEIIDKSPGNLMRKLEMQGSHRLEKYLNLEDSLEKSFKI